MTTTQDSGIAQGEAVLAQAVSAYQRAFGPRMIAAYALGSLAHGGFHPLVSDVDLGLIVADPVRVSDAETVLAAADEIRTGDSDLHTRLSVFWGTPSTLAGRRPGGRFPPLDRLDLLEHGRGLFGPDVRAGIPRPSRDDLVIAGAKFALGYLGGDATTEELRRPEVLVSRGVRRLTKLTLFPVRFLFTAATGEVGTNHAAVAHYLGGRQPGTDLVAAALGWRTVPPQDHTAARLLAAGIVPLYLHYLEDHADRLVALGRSDLARDFRGWAGRLCLG